MKYSPEVTKKLNDWNRRKESHGEKMSRLELEKTRLQTTPILQIFPKDWARIKEVSPENAGLTRITITLANERIGLVSESLLPEAIENARVKHEEIVTADGIVRDKLIGAGYLPMAEGDPGKMYAMTFDMVMRHPVYHEAVNAALGADAEVTRLHNMIRNDKELIESCTDHLDKARAKMLSSI